MSETRFEIARIVVRFLTDSGFNVEVAMSPHFGCGRVNPLTTDFSACNVYSDDCNATLHFDDLWIEVHLILANEPLRVEYADPQMLEHLLQLLENSC